MPETHDQDRWRELAELLGLPPDENKSSGPPRAAHDERRNEVHADEARQNASRRQGWEPTPVVAEVDEAQPVAESSFEPREEVVQGDVSHFDVAPPDFSDESFERELPEPVSLEPEAEREPDDASAQERPRRGRKRGRRGNRGDSREREERPRHERAPRAGEMHRETEEAPGESATSDSRGELADEEARHLSGESDMSIEDADEDVFETAGPAAQNPLAEVDDEEIDKLTDLNLPSWTDLIASLYRPER